LSGGWRDSGTQGLFSILTRFRQVELSESSLLFKSILGVNSPEPYFFFDMCGITGIFPSSIDWSGPMRLPPQITARKAKLASEPD
jgi:hypothetical protein